MNNIFLTGEKKIGKTTIINRVLKNFDLKMGGFRTLPDKVYYQQGRHLLQAVDVKSSVTKGVPISGFNADGNLRGLPASFEEQGVEILKEGLSGNYHLLLMDELGIFEEQATSFQQWVFKSLSSSIPVLGVIKAKKSPFLDKLRQREDLRLFGVNLDNREQLPDTIEKFLQAILQDTENNSPH